MAAANSFKEAFANVEWYEKNEWWWKPLKQLG